MAAGNQAENGACALLVKAAKTNSVIIIKFQVETITKLKDPRYLANPMEPRKAASPTRFLKIVNIPALADESDW